MASKTDFASSPGHGETRAERTTSERGLRRVRRMRRVAVVVAVAILVGVLLQVAASFVATLIVNRKLSGLDTFTGHVDEVRVALWKGGAEIRDFTFQSRGTEGQPPIVHVRRASMVASLPALVRGHLGGRIKVHEVELNFVKRERFEGPVDAAREAGEKLEEKKEEAAHWQDVLREALPMEITRLDVVHGRVRFIDPTHQPVVDVGVDDFQMTATGLRNRGNGQAYPTRVRLSGVMTGGGTFQIQVQADPLAEPVRFESTAELRGLDLPSYNLFLRTYTGMDVSRGSFDFDLQVRADGGRYDGFTKPFFRDLDFTNVGDKEKPFVKRVAESAVDAVSKVLKSPETEKVASIVPFSGTFEEGNADVWTSLSNLLRNAFIEAIREGVG